MTRPKPSVLGALAGASALVLAMATMDRPTPAPVAELAVEPGSCHFDPTLAPGGSHAFPINPSDGICGPHSVGSVSTNGKYRCAEAVPGAPMFEPEKKPDGSIHRWPDGSGENLAHGALWLALWDCPTSVPTRAMACQHSGGCTVRCTGQTCAWYHSTRAAS